MAPDPNVRRTAPPDATTTLAATVSARDTIVDRYELVEPIGSGGMGRVFLARDLSLKRQVAVKVLSADLASQPHFAEHMLREARAVAQLQHPHIATVYDVVDDGGSICIVMEYLEGETLASRLRRGPLEYGEAIRRGCEIAAALEHAHSRGIAHCDLKPGNIFLTERGGAKVVDFGLSRVFGGSPDDPTEGIGASPALIARRAGTPRYMAPEQRLGLPLDQRADIYSFGVVLHEMFTGTLPPLASAEHGPNVTADLRGLPDDVAAALTPVFKGTLATDAVARFQSASEVDQALQRLPAPRRRRRWPAYALVLAALAVVVGALLIALRTRPPRVLGGGPGPPVVAVSRLMSASGDASLSYLASGLGEVVASDLGASNAVVAARSDAVVTSPDEAAALARSLGADALVLGKVERTDGQVVVGVRLFTAGTGSFTEISSFSRGSDDLVGIRRAITSTIRSQLRASGVNFSDSFQGAGNATEQLLPATMDSFEEYAQARGFLERTDVDASIDHAISVLNRIVAREPGFALAHAALGEATWRKWRSTREPAWSDAALKHALEALRLSSNQPEVRYAVALVYQGTGRSKEALSELEQVARSRPTNDDVQRLMGRLYADSGQLEKGLKSLQRAVDLRPGYWGNHAALGNAAYRAGLYPEAISAFQRYCELRPDSASAHQRLGTAYHAAGNLQAALQSYERALQMSPNANAYSNVGTLQFDAGRYPEAVKAYTRAVELEPRNPSLHRNLADALRRAGQSRRAASEYALALTLAGDALRVNPQDASTLSLKAVALARTGKLAEAERTSAAAVALAPTENEAMFEHAVILTMLGRKADALDALRRAVAAGYSPTRLRGDPDLVSLADQPQFRELTSGKR